MKRFRIVQGKIDWALGTTRATDRVCGLIQHGGIAPGDIKSGLTDADVFDRQRKLHWAA